ncbi:hypothetical protein COCON_G00045510 [Conger conger]|uniref:Insulin receptor substrate 2-B n=1 Tax=Conger conger TaxID=82655 RepID=A0A9Q1DUF1_CONCO|nr:insulin receptor substrate 2-B [Conger conger]KAJ8282032.1 hypothetical protein COCON_G00045510 [Conger conger]
MANLMNYQESNAAMLMLETQQRAIGTKTTTATANGDTSAGEPPSPLIKIDGARVHQHLPPPYHQALQSKEHQQQHHCQAQHFPAENVQETPVRKIPSSCINVVHQNAAASQALAASTTATTTLAAAASASSDVVDDIRKCGYLRKQKHGHKRFFVLRGPSHLGPSRLEYYDSEKKFRNSLRSAAAAAAAATAATTTSPKRVIYLYQCFTVNKRADSKNKYLIALYTKDEYFAIVAENEQEQDDWYLAVSDLMNEGKKSHLDADEVDDGYGTVTPGTVFKEVWQVNVKPKGLGQTKNLTGVYRLCLSTKTIHLVKLNSETPCVNLQLMNIRRCGHSESFFFIEVGRSSSIGPGEIWMQVDDSVVAQNMHETILETMKALKAFTEFRPRSKSQSSGSNPMAFITTRRHLGNLPPSQTGLQRRSRTESVVGTPPTSKSSGMSGYRFRTSSEGEGTMNRPFRSVTGSLVHLSAARINLGRQEGGGRYVRALPGSTYHTRSASLPVSHFPSTTSPVSVSSSSGHGSASDTLTRPSSASICGSPSDGGFNSSDEYGSSPGDFRYFRVRSNTPDSLGNTPPIREENCLNDYMAMGRYREVMICGAETLQDESADEERAIRRRTHSSSRPTGGSNGVTMYQKMTQTTSSLDESMPEASPLGSNGHLTCQVKPPSPHSNEHRKPSKDDGYMPMMPGVVPSRDGDYMPMQPSAHLTASQPGLGAATQQVDSQGYMMMLPRGGSSPSQASPRHSSDHRQNGEYMDMSQSCATVLQKPSNESYYLETTPETPKSYSPYFSLPRSYKAPLREKREHSEYVPMSSPVKPAYTSTECSRNSASNPPAHLGPSEGCGELQHVDRLAVRPTRLSLGRHNFHGSPSVSEAAEPASSPGEYINIEFGDRHVYTPSSLSAEGSPSSLGSSSEQRRSPLHDEYIGMDFDKGHLSKGHSPRPSLVAPWNPPSYIRPLASASTLGGRMDTEMGFGLGAEVKSPTAMLQHLCVMEKHYPSQPPPSPPVEPRVIRADPQGRRRHSSETFSSSPPSNGNPATPTSPHLMEGAKWQSSTSFDSVWLHMDDTASSSTAATPVPTDVGCSPAGQTCQNGSAGHQNGLNYIALDLREDPRAIAPSPPSPLPHPENGAYASIDFAKSEGLTAASQD